MSEHDWTEVVGAIGIFALLTTVITVTIVQLATSWRAKAALAREGAYRELAEAAVRAQEATERQLGQLNGRLAALEARVGSVERVLKEVE
ncbi:MAG TPA: hypothetical protein VES42_17580 [Pilimelia sp.]|nr:hypothetical protein [Pilimelia sp.]